MGLAIDMYALQNRGKMCLSMERTPFDPVAIGLADGGHGRTWAGLLRDICKIPVQVFHCPADQREFTLTDKSFYVFTSGSDDAVNDPQFAFSYGIPYFGYNNPYRRMPWSLVPSTFQLYPGSLARTKLKNASSLSLIWDAHTTMITFNGTTSTPVDKPFVFYRDSSWPLAPPTPQAPTTVTSNIWRHSQYTVNGRRRGPNALFADGHCEPTVNIYAWTDDNVSLRGNASLSN